MKDIFTPDILTLITTYKCTASCASCCFGCSPKRDKMMGEMEMISYIDDSMKAYPEIKVLVLTGGEVLALGLDVVCRIISYVKNKYGIFTRIVSNGFWALSESKTREVVNSLSKAGLDELNISTGDVHAEYIPIKNVCRIIDFHESNSELKTLCVVVERHDDEKLSIEMLNDWIVQKYGDNHKTITMESPWVDFSNYGDWKNIKSEEGTEYDDFENHGCGNLYAGIQINPEGQFLACCGFASEYSPFLKIGNITANRDCLREYLEEKHHDLLFMWIHTVGPRYIYRRIYGIDPPIGKHMCEICMKLITSSDSVEKITQIIERESKYIYTNFLQARLRYEKERHAN
ncbi:hypothetical protein [Porphyromonas levii]|uniref:hypothetical protein n=1 Tax=Porphyromonas levii TaxID=28114 RepID=UPI001BADCEB9|nr:hypothetical protein [Porphyromonas levii]